MCGIAGIVSAGGIAHEERVALAEMLRLLAHRGPDDEARYDDAAAALGHRRLSIIDAAGSRQPIANEDETIWTVSNGEIYNFVELRRDLAARGHRFCTAGDAECLVHLYEQHGDDCVRYAHGMFAFAIWDARRRRILLARDRIGVKPLYYRCDDRRLVFASELKAILAMPGLERTIDLTALADYLTFGFVPSPKSILRGVHKLPPGTLLVYEDGRARLSRYWDLHFQGWKDAPADQCAEMLWDQLQQATRRRLVADVPIGALLSGGADSAAVAACLSPPGGEPIRTMTCGFREETFDERAAARRTAGLIGSRHNEELALASEDADPGKLTWHFDEPFADASAIAMFALSRAAARHAKVMLSGDGGDEVLAGYRRYRFDVYEEALRRVMPPGLGPALGAAGRVFPTWPWLPRPLRAGATLRNAAVDSATAHAQSIATLQRPDVWRLLAPDVAEELGAYDPLDRPRALYRTCDAPDHLSRCQYVDIRFGLADDMLVKVDRAAMAHGLEVRSPLLDFELIEAAWTIPPRMRIRNRAGKYPLRLALARHLDEQTAWRKKSGFEVPIDAWCRGELAERIENQLLASDGPLSSLIAPAAVQTLWAQHRLGRAHGHTLWRLLMLDAWRRHPYSLSLPGRGQGEGRITSAARFLTRCGL